MDNASIEYFRGRERVEREAARNATCDEARRSHEQLAAEYAALIEQAEANPWKSAGPVSWLGTAAH